LENRRRNNDRLMFARSSSSSEGQIYWLLLRGSFECESWAQRDAIPLRSNVVSVGEGSDAWPSLSGEAYASSMAENKSGKSQIDTTEDFLEPV